MLNIRFRPEHRPGPRCGKLTGLPQTSIIPALRGPTCKGRKRRGQRNNWWKGEGDKRCRQKGRGFEEREKKGVGALDDFRAGRPEI